ncbi:MAG: Hpt domain-containing protein [Cognaticolwellia sp.]
MTTSQHLDLTLINGYLEALDLDVIEQMLNLYIQQSAVYLTAINSALAAKEQKSWQEQCHKMKGAAASAGLSQVHQQLTEIEKSTEEWAQKAQQISVLTALNQQAITTFQHWLAEQ